jgi:hypothetical protein
LFRVIALGRFVGVFFRLEQRGYLDVDLVQMYDGILLELLLVTEPLPADGKDAVLA